MTHLSEQERQTLWHIADVLIPATTTRPSLRDADPEGIWLERALTARVDLVGALQAELALLATASDLEPAIVDLHESDLRSFRLGREGAPGIGLVPQLPAPEPPGDQTPPQPPQPQQPRTFRGRGLRSLS